MKYFTIIIATFFAYSLQGQTGIVSGKVRANDGKNLTDVKVFVTGGTDTVVTDVEGKFSMVLPYGNYVINFDLNDFDTLQDSVSIENGTDLFLNKTMRPIQLGHIGPATIRVTKRAKENTVVGAIQSKQLAVQVAEAISSEDFKKTTIRTTGDALKRIPGATIMEGKFANIRGMFDRYNAGYLNGAPLPSTETDRKAFSFDIIPANLLDDIVVIKSATPDLIGDFGGGIIRINTKSIPVKLTQSINLGFQYNSITTFKSIQTFSSTGSEYFGIPGAKRGIPNLEGDLLHVNPENNALQSKKFDNDWTVSNTRPMLTPRFSYTLGIPFKLKKQRELGILISANYSLTQKYSDGVVNKFDMSDNRAQQAFNDKLFNSTVQNGGIINLSYKLNNRNRIDFKNLYTLNYDASSTFRKGVSDFDNEVQSEGFSNLVNYNRLISTQMNGTHIIGKNQTSINWLVNYGNTHREVPDFRIASYANFGPGERYLVTNDFFNAGSGRFFSNLNENTGSASFDLKHSLKTGKLVTNMKYGVFSQFRNRTFASREFVYGPVGKTIKSDNNPDVDLSEAKIASNGLYLVEKTGKDLDEYTGTSRLNAAYVMFENHYPLYKVGSEVRMLKVIYGLRFEQFGQIIKNDIFTNIYKKDVSNQGNNNDFLPSVNLIAPLAAKSGLRFSYYKTLNRPEMRELAPFTFYNFNLNSEIGGNTQLNRAVLHNFDFRYEFFPGKEDMFSIGAFAKTILNPIEFSLDPSQALIRTFTYKNEKSADIKGMELELRKKLNFISKWGAKSIFDYLSLYANFSLIKSKVKFSEGSTAVANRPLQGQSPYVINTSLFYDNDKNGWNASVNFNKIGSRIAYVGTPENIQRFGMDIYEFGRSILDFQIGKNLGKNGKNGNIKFTLGDVLAQESIFYQDVNKSGKYEKAGDNTLFGYTNGSTMTISYSLTF